ncbi:glycosyltransferase family 2 protein [Actinomadura viridis]|uniref:glycosyltransferase family 2 protein n=1 Tax=Actinomadura viridis TaxID=58110 RepID=UPI003681D2F3
MLSVVIPTRDKAGSLRATLACLLRSPDLGSVEIIVVDDGSADRTPALLGAAGPPVRVAWAGGTGRAAARNAGAALARHPYLLFLDDDILTGPGFLAAHLRHASGADGDGGRFVHGPLLEFPGARRWLASVADVSDESVVADAAKVVAGHGPRLVRNALERAVLEMDEGRPPRVPWLAAAGANLALPRAVFTRLGGFDEDFGSAWGCEDLELGLRLVEAGLRPVVERDAAGVHLTHGRPGRWEEHDLNLARFVAKHDLPEVRALPALLGERGGPGAYAARLAEMPGVPAVPPPRGR